MRSNRRGNDYYDDYSNPGYLDVRYHHIPEFKNNEATLKVKIPGDGNCGFTSLALGLMRLIAQDELVLTSIGYDQLLKILTSSDYTKTIRARARYYADGIPRGGLRVRLKHCFEPITRFLKALEQGELNSFDQLKHYLFKHQDYHSILALAICLAPALRILALQLKKESYPQISHIEGQGFVEAATRDGEDAGFPLLNLLSGFFEIHLLAYNHANEAIGGSYGDMPREEKGKTAQPLIINKPLITLGYSESPGHWDLLLPMSAFLKPPFYLSFDFGKEAVAFDRGYHEEKERCAERFLPPEILESDFTTRKKEIQGFRNELFKLETALTALSDETEIKIGTTLIGILENNLNLLFTPKEASREQRSAQQQAFKDCNDALITAQTHFSWGHENRNPSIAAILANLALFIGTLGLPYLIAAGIHYAATSRIGFFHKPPALLRNELPAVSQELTWLYSHKVDEAKSTPLEALPELPPFKEWSRFRL